MYGKLKEGVLYYAPADYELENGEIITNFNQDEELMRKYGFKNVIDIPPLYDDKVQYLKIDNYTENKENISIEYILNEILVTPTYEERLACVEEVILNLL